MADARDFELHHRDFFALDLAGLLGGEGGAADPLLAGRRVDEQYRVVVGVDVGLHESAPYQLDLRMPGS